MVEDLAQALLEIIVNSISAGAHNIMIQFIVSELNNDIILQVEDDGKGMDAETIERVTNPFYTSRKTRKVGLGLAFFKGLSEMLNGSFRIDSEVGKGTTVRMTMEKNNIDLPKQGNLGEMMMIALHAGPDCEFTFTYQYNEARFDFDTKQVKEILETNRISDPDVLMWVKDFINQEVERTQTEVL